MELNCQHAVIRVTDVAAAKDFYVNKLGLKLIEEAGNFFAAKAGGVRLSVFGGCEKTEPSEEAKTGVSLIFRTDNLDAFAKELASKGVNHFGDIVDIPNFHKFMEYEDPDGNVFFLAQYYVEPI
jgi:catechol 2,3-dioxygenase-like lactoylglutathione lyase family enzyme